jgi:DNA polymerase-3 subunit epsilon
MSVFRAIWPITDETVPVRDLIAEARADLPAVARRHGLVLTADVAHCAVRIARAIGRQHQPPADPHVLHMGQIAWRAQQCESLQDWLRRTSDPTTVVDPTWPVHPYREEAAA